MAHLRLRQFIYGGGIVGTGMGVISVIGLASNIIIIRNLDPQVFGILSLGMVIVGVASKLFVLGLPEGVARIMNETEETNETITTAVTIALVVTLTGTLILISVRKHIATMFNSPQLSSILIVLSGVLFVKSMKEILVGPIRGFEEARIKVIYGDVVPQTIGICILIGLVTFGQSIAGAIAFWFVPPLIAIALFANYLYSTIDITRPSAQAGNRLLRFSIPLAASGIFSTMMLYLDVLFVGFYLPVTEVAFYRSAQPLARLPVLVLSAMVFLYLPHATKHYVSGEVDELEKLFKTTTKWASFVGWPVVTLFLFHSTPILQYLYQQEYSQAGPVASLLILGMFLRVVVGPTGATIQAIDATKIDGIGVMIAFIVNILLNFILVPKFGSLGAAAATTIGFFAYNIIELGYIYSQIGIVSMSKKQLIALMPVLIFSFGLSIHVPNPSPLILIGIVISIGLLHIISMSVLGLESWEREHILNSLNTIPLSKTRLL